MTRPNHHPPDGGTISWLGVAAGFVGAPLTIFVVDRLMETGEPYVLYPLAAVLFGVIVVKREDAFWRSVPVGMLLSVAGVLLVFAGMCFGGQL